MNKLEIKGDETNSLFILLLVTGGACRVDVEGRWEVEMAAGENKFLKNLGLLFMFLSMLAE